MMKATLKVYSHALLPHRSRLNILLSGWLVVRSKQNPMDPPLERVDDYFWMRDDKRESEVGAMFESRF